MARPPNPLALIALTLLAPLGACTAEKHADAGAMPRSASLDPLQTSPGDAAVFDVQITARGFEPARLRVSPGQPVVLRVTRTLEHTCADAIDVAGDPVRHPLPLNQRVELKLIAPASGELAFACPMHLFRGALVVTP